MSKYPSSSLVVSTYNWPQALKPVLESIRSQSVLPGEVIIADDGSEPDTAELIRQLKQEYPVPLVHVWQEDKGFRPSKIRNKAVCHSQADYIIQIDGDVLLHPKFVEDHLRFARKGAFLVGSRVLLSEHATAEQKLHPERPIRWYTSSIKNRANALHIPLLTPFLRVSTRNVRRTIEAIRGCNMSFWREDFLAVNGYNEAFLGWGREDSELGVRFINHGLQKDRLKFSAIQYHLHHEERTRARLPENNLILEKTVREKIAYCAEGIADHCVRLVEA